MIHVMIGTADFQKKLKKEVDKPNFRSYTVYNS